MATSEENLCWIGFDLGGTKMLATVFDSRFEIVGRERTKTKGYEGAEAGVARIIKTIRKAMENAKVSDEQLGGIGIGIPGPLDLDRGLILNTPNLGWTNVRIKDLLEDEFSCPTVIANDVDAGVYGEYRFGAGRDARTVVGVFPGTGIGGGCVYEGNILRGKTGSCMEIGHV
ncbi:MAG: ROK family protein, partial [Pirellulales bacterium]